MLTGAQIRAARAFLGWSARELSERSGVSLPTIQRIEQQQGVPTSKVHTLMDLKRTLEASGIEFTGTPDEAPGVRLRTSRAGP